MECQTCCEIGLGVKFGRAVHAEEDVTEPEHFNCFECWEKHVSTRLEVGNSSEIHCLQCEHVLEEQDMRTLSERFTEDFYTW